MFRKKKELILHKVPDNRVTLNFSETTIRHDGHNKNKPGFANDWISENTQSESLSGTLKPAVEKSISSIFHPPAPINLAIVDVDYLIQTRIRKFSGNEFIYLAHAYPPGDVQYSPYLFEEVPFSKINKSAYFTLSKEGLTFWSAAENNIMKIEDWYEEYKMFCQLKKIKLFKLFCMWKNFTMWRKTVQWRKFLRAALYLKRNLFLVNPTLAKALLRFQEEICKLNDLKFCDIPKTDNWPIFYFYELQMVQCERTRNALNDFRRRMKDVLYEACYEAIKQEGFSDEMINDEIANNPLIRDEISFTDRTNKRNFCAILTKFLGLCDYKTINVLHRIIRKTFVELGSVLQMHESLGPTMETIQENSDISKEFDRTDDEHSPLLVLNLMLDTDIIQVLPTHEDTLQLFQQLLTLNMEIILKIKSFQSDPFFTIFTEPSFLGHKEDRLYKKPPKVNFLLEIDETLNEHRNSIGEHLNAAFDKIEIYIVRFQTIRKNYQHSMMTDKESLTQETNMNELLLLHKKCLDEINVLESVLPACNLGIFQLKQDSFKEKIIENYNEFLTFLELITPGIESEIESIHSIQDSMIV